MNLKQFVNNCYFPNIYRFTQMQVLAGFSMFLCIVMTLVCYVSKIMSEPRRRKIFGNNERYQPPREHED